MALLWLPSQHCIVAAKQGERRPSLGLSEGGQAAAAAKGQSEGLTQHRPANPRHASSPEGQGRLTAALQVAPDALASSLALRKLVCPSGSRVPCPVGAASQVPDPQPLRRGLHDKQSPLFSTTPPALRPSSPPAAVTVPACKLLAGNKRLCSGRTRGASPPLSRRAVRSAAAGRNCSGGGRLSSPFQHHHSRRPARAAPLEARERAARTAREEDGGGANREPRWEGRGRRQGLEAEAPREGRPGVGEKDPRTSRTIRLPLTLHTRGRRRAPAREGERTGTVLVTPGKSPDKGKPHPPSAAPPSFQPTGYEPSPRANPEGAPPPPLLPAGCG